MTKSMFYKFCFSIGVIGLVLLFGAGYVSAQCGPDGTQPCNTGTAKASVNTGGTKKVISKAKTNPASSQQSKTKPAKTKKDDESIYNSLKLDPKAAKNAGASNEMFPLNGVTPGKTTETQLQLLKGQRKVVFDPTTKGTSVFYTVKNSSFALQNGVVDSISIFIVDPMPQRWRELGFEWNLSFNQYIALLTRLGFQIDYKLPPPPNMRPGERFTGKVVASKKDGIPLKILTNFSFSGDKPSVNSPATLFWISVSAPK